MKETTERLLVSTLVVCYFLVVFSSETDLQISSHDFNTCRIPEKESWGWGESLVYKKDQNSSELYDFNGLHHSMKQKIRDVQSKYKFSKDDRDSNVCVARFSFIWHKIGEQGTGVEHLYLTSQDPLTPYIFFSNYPITVCRRGKKFGLTAKECCIDNKEKSKTFRYTETSENSPNAVKTGDVFICPHQNNTHIDFSSWKGIFKRYYCLYKSKTPSSPIKAELAFCWKEFCAEKDADCIIKWYEVATREGPYVADHRTVNSDSNEVFFTNNYDSEQKMLYFLNNVTDCIQLIDIWDDLINGLLRSLQPYSCYVGYKIRTELNSEKIKIRKKLLADLIKDLPKQQTRIKQKQGWNDAVCGLKEFEQNFRMQYGQSPHMTKNASSFSDAIKKLLDIFNDDNDPGTFQDEKIDDIEKLLSSLKIMPDKKGNMDEKGNEGKKGNKKDKKETSFLNLNQAVQDSLIKGFDEVVEKFLKDNSNRYISGIVLNIGNYFDCCYSCAPDLAQELTRGDGFASYFKAAVKNKQAERYCDLPEFYLIASCQKKRDDKWCPQCVVSVAKSPILGGLGDVKYYQHLLKDQPEVFYDAPATVIDDEMDIDEVLRGDEILHNFNQFKYMQEDCEKASQEMHDQHAKKATDENDRATSSTTQAPAKKRRT